MANFLGVYCVSKIRHIDLWKKLRDHGAPIISSWIDDGGPEEIDFSVKWPVYLKEASSADVLFVYVDGDDKLKGGLLEIGAGLAAGATVVVVGEIPELKTAIQHDNLIEAESLPHGLRIVNEVLRDKWERGAGWSQQRIIGDWALRCFGPASYGSIHERSRRVLEEAIELAQVGGLTEAEVHELVTYVYGRPVGELEQELAGLSLTILALADSRDVDLEVIKQEEIKRVLSLPVEHFKKRLAVKVAAGVAVGDTTSV